VKAALTSRAPEAMQPPPVQTSMWFLICSITQLLRFD
jgi:hypothetical protein